MFADIDNIDATPEDPAFKATPVPAPNIKVVVEELTNSCPRCW